MLHKNKKSFCPDFVQNAHSPGRPHMDICSYIHMLGTKRRGLPLSALTPRSRPRSYPRFRQGNTVLKFPCSLP